MIIIKRVITAAVGILILIPLCIFSNTCAWPIGVTVFTLFAMYELCSAVGFQKNIRFLIPSFLIGLMPITVWIMRFILEISLYHALFFSILAYIIYMLVLSILTDEVDMDSIASFAFYSIYVAVGYTAFAMIRFINFGKYLMIISFLVPWSTDTFAYFGGRAFGKHKLCPTISPKKTVEGAICGSLSQIIVLGIFAFIINHFYDAGANYINFALFGIVLSFISQFGDLFMSRIKRRHDIKDFGNLFPGHGGSLDRFDSVIAASMLILFFNSLIGMGFLFI